MKAQTTKPVAGVDVGYNYTKAKTAQGEALFRSIIGPAIAISYRSGIGRGVTGYEVARYGRQHFIGELARAQSPNPMTPQSRQRDLEIVVTLALTALAATGARGDMAKLVTGLPVSWYKQDHDALEHALTGHHEIAVDGEVITFDIDAVRVVPQPFGTFFSQIVSDAGSLTDGKLAKGKVAIFDVGGHTTDLALSDSLEFIEKASGSIPVASGAYYDFLGRAISERYRLDLDAPGIEDAARTGEVTLWGKSVRLSDEMIDAALDSVTPDIVEFAKNKWNGDAKTFAAILVSGGAGALFYDRIHAAFPSARLVDGAQMANVVGFYRFGLLLERMGK